MAIYDVLAARTAQAKYCKETGAPHFAPESGKCWSCGKNIYSAIEHGQKDWNTRGIIGKFTTGITVEKAGSKLVTGCPHCNRSYCD